MIDINLAKESFKKYVSNFDGNNKKIAHKIKHTYKTLEEARYIATNLNLDITNTDLAILIALLHDIGRFKQIELYDTFDDYKSIDHGDYAVKLLFEDNLIREFIKEETYDEIIKISIKNHNKLKIENLENLDETIAMHAKIVRDADKLDIYRVLTEGQTQEKIDNWKEYLQAEEITKIMNDNLMQHTLIKYTTPQTCIDKLVMPVSYTYDMYYKCSIERVLQKDYINTIIDLILPHTNEKTKQQLEHIRKSANEYLKAESAK